MNLDKLNMKKRSLQRGPPAAKRAKVAEEVSTISAARPQEVVPPPTAPVSEVVEGVESYVEMMAEGLENLLSLSPEKEELHRKDGGGKAEVRPPLEDSKAQTPTSPSRGAGKGVVLSDDEDVRVLDAETTHKQSAFGGGPRFTMPEVTCVDGSSFFVPGFTLPPLGLGTLQQAREAGTRGSTNAYSYYMSQVRINCELMSTFLALLC